MKPLIIALTLTALLFLGVSYILVSEASADPTCLGCLEMNPLGSIEKLVTYRDKQCEGFTEAFEWVKNATTYDEMYDALRVWDIALNRCQGAVELIELYEKGL